MPYTCLTAQMHPTIMLLTRHQSCSSSGNLRILILGVNTTSDMPLTLIYIIITTGDIDAGNCSKTGKGPWQVF